MQNGGAFSGPTADALAEWRAVLKEAQREFRSASYAGQESPIPFGTWTVVCNGDGSVNPPMALEEALVLWMMPYIHPVMARTGASTRLMDVALGAFAHAICSFASRHLRIGTPPSQQPHSAQPPEPVHGVSSEVTSSPAPSAPTRTPKPIDLSAALATVGEQASGMWGASGA